MRDWHLTANDPLSMRFAADVRLRRTDYADDQSWEVAFGGKLEPALLFQTRYGGRAGLARIVPMWVVDGKPIYEGGALAGQPVLHTFTPNYARITAQLTANLGLTAELWVMESHAVGGRFTMDNKSSAPVSLQLEVFGQVVREGQMIEMNLLSLEGGAQALHLGEIGNLNPILLLEHSVGDPTPVPRGEHVSPKLSAPLIIPAGGQASARWLHSGLPSMEASLGVAYQWLYQANWDAALTQIERANANLPDIETGLADWDTALALGAQLILRSFISPTLQADKLPYPTFVSARIPSRGFSQRLDGSDHSRQWNGQPAALDFLALPSVALLAPDLARNAFRNALAVQQPDGWVDNKPGLSGQRANLLSLPLLATTAWRIYEVTEDSAFIGEVFPGLQRFFERWFGPDMDKDQDGLPEWTTAAQSSYPDNPTFVRYRRWARNADINKAESPDLAAYLAAEAHSLLNMAQLLNQSDAAQAVQKRLDTLTGQLNALWNEAAGSYLYRDRDTHLTLTGTTLYQGKGGDSFDSGARLDPPNRLILRVIGGKDHTPHVSATIEGVDVRGNHVAESVPVGEFVWHYGMGTAVSEHAYSQVSYVKFEGLSRVYSTEISTVDLTGTNQTLLLPLWAQLPDQKRADKLAQAITDEKRYWRPFGMPVCPANDPAFAANNDGGSGGVWMLWNTLLIEGLLHYGRTAEALTLFTRLMDAEIKALRRDRAFREAYNSENGDGLGDLDELGGILPLHLFMELIGLRVINPRRLWAGGLFALPKPVKVTQFGVEITRSAAGTTVRFPSGHTAQVGPEWQVIEDPTPPPPPTVPEAAAQAAGPLPEQLAGPGIPELEESASIIPVDTRKTDTMEIPIRGLDLGVQPPETGDMPRPAGRSPDSPGAIKIPVKGPEDEQ